MTGGVFFGKRMPGLLTKNKGSGCDMFMCSRGFSG